MSGYINVTETKQVSRTCKNCLYYGRDGRIRMNKNYIAEFMKENDLKIEQGLKRNLRLLDF